MTGHIVIIDDDHTTEELLRGHMAGPSVAYTRLMKADAALSHLKGLRPSLVVINADLPKGWNVCAALKKDPKTRGYPLLLISATATEEIFSQHQKLPTRADAYLRKPLTIDRLGVTVTALLAGRSSDDKGADVLAPSLDTEESLNGNFLTVLGTSSAEGAASSDPGSPAKSPGIPAPLAPGSLEQSHVRQALELEALRRQLEALEFERDAMSQRARELADVRDQLAQKLAAVSQQSPIALVRPESREVPTTTASASVEDSEALRARAARAESEVSELRLERQTLSDELSAMKARCEVMEATQREVEARLSTSAHQEQELRDVRAQLSSERLLMDQIKSTTASATEALASAHARIDELEHEREAERAELGAVKNTQDVLATQVKQLNEALERQRGDQSLKDAQISALEAECARLNATLGSSCEAVQEAEQRLVKGKAELASARATSDELNQQVLEAQTAHGRLEGYRAELEARLRVLEAELVTSRTETDELRGSLQSTRKALYAAGDYEAVLVEHLRVVMRRYDEDCATLAEMERGLRSSLEAYSRRDKWFINAQKTLTERYREFMRSMDVFLGVPGSDGVMSGDSPSLPPSPPRIPERPKLAPLPSVPTKRSAVETSSAGHGQDQVASRTEERAAGSARNPSEVGVEAKPESPAPRAASRPRIMMLSHPHAELDGRSS